MPFNLTTFLTKNFTKGEKICENERVKIPLQFDEFFCQKKMQKSQNLTKGEKICENERVQIPLQLDDFFCQKNNAKI